MKKLKRWSLWTAAIALILYALLCTFLYFFQESLIFFPDKLPRDYKYTYDNDYSEYFITLNDGHQINALQFHADSSKGLIFYLHGNAGALDTWGSVADIFLENNYDVFIMDYRGYGKSESKVRNEREFYEDAQLVYDTIKTKYEERNIIIAGYSLGTGVATYLASENNPGKLILKAPYYNFSKMAKDAYPIAPEFVLKYKFKTNEMIENVKAPIYIFHGDMDEMIPYESSIKLKEHIKPTDEFITLNEQMHNGISYNTTYQDKIRLLLNSNK